MSTQGPNLRRNPQRIALLTDSCADLTAKQRKGKPIFVLPLKIRCGTDEFSDGVDIFSRDVYRRLDAGETLRTSLPPGSAVLDTLAEKSRQLRPEEEEKEKACSRR